MKQQCIGKEFRNMCVYVDFNLLIDFSKMPGFATDDSFCQGFGNDGVSYTWS